MKKMSLYAVLCLAGFCSQSCKDNRFTPVHASRVPEQVKGSFNALYATAQDVNWEIAGADNNVEFYEVKFKLDGKQAEAEFDKAGRFLKEE